MFLSNDGIDFSSACDRGHVPSTVIFMYGPPHFRQSAAPCLSTGTFAPYCVIVQLKPDGTR